MNFVLHHELARRDLGSAAAAAGAMLPDLWRMADRRVRIARVAVEPSGPLLRGIAHHAESDRWFHADRVFVDGERLARERLREAEVAAPRIGLFAHVLWEMCLDGELVRRRRFDAVMGEVRAALAFAVSDEARSAVEAHHFARVARTEDERARFEARLARIVEELSRGPWIEGYQSGDGIAERLDGVRSRLGFAPMAVDERSALASVAEGLLEAAGGTVGEILGRR